MAEFRFPENIDFVEIMELVGYVRTKQIAENWARCGVIVSTLQGTLFQQFQPDEITPIGAEPLPTDLDALAEYVASHCPQQVDGQTVAGALSPSLKSALFFIAELVLAELKKRL